MQQFEVGDLVGIGWNGRLNRKCPAIVVRVIEHTFGGFVYVVRTLDEEARESWCDAESLKEWKTDII
jgi:hypothetical protein